VFTRQLGKRVEVTYLGLYILCGTGKPEALNCASVNAQRSTDGVAISAGLQRIVLGEDLDSFPLPAVLHGYVGAQSDIAYVKPAIARRERLSHEYPEMPATPALLKRGIHAVLLQDLAKLGEVCERVRVISVDGDPLASLRGGVDGVKANGDFPFQVAADGVWRQTESLARCLVGGPVIIMMASYPMRPVGLNGVGPAIHEEAKIIGHNHG
jgi:hypothetical protein